MVCLSVCITPQLAAAAMMSGLASATATERASTAQAVAGAAATGASGESWQRFLAAVGEAAVLLLLLLPRLVYDSRACLKSHPKRPLLVTDNYIALCCPVCLRACVPVCVCARLYTGRSGAARAPAAGGLASKRLMHEPATQQQRMFHLWQPASAATSPGPLSLYAADVTLTGCCSSHLYCV